MVLLAKRPEYLQYPKVKKPHLECAHTTRSRMLADLTESIGRSYILWKTLFATGHTFIQEPSNEETENFDDLHQHLQTAHIERLLAAEMVKCPSCASKRKPPSYMLYPPRSAVPASPIRYTVGVEVAGSAD